jgi:hypothetical protein
LQASGGRGRIKIVIACPLPFRRSEKSPAFHAAIGIVAVALPRSAGRCSARDEEERPVPAVVQFGNVDRTAERAAELVALEAALATPLRLLAAIGVNLTVAQELKCGPMERVGA